ncbi:MAG: helix-turn-helix domain-containing protein [Alphaproteobacteria bacterium]
MTPFTIGALSRRSGCHIETIRYYERIGLMPSPARTQGGHRAYGADAWRRLVFIRRCRELGFTIEQIRGLLDLVDRGDYTCAEVYDIAQQHLRALRDKIADLKRMESVLRGMAARCDEGEVPSCHIIEALSRT